MLTMVKYFLQCGNIEIFLVNSFCLMPDYIYISAFKKLVDILYLSIGDNVIKNDQLEFAEDHISITIQVY